MPDVTQVDKTSWSRRGEGPVVVLLHGWCLSRELWTYQEDALADRCEVVTVDLPGFGRSSHLPGPYSLERLADEVARIVGELDAGPATIGGFAFGALVALVVARRHPEAAKDLFLVGVPSPAFSPYDRMPGAIRRDWPEFARRSARAICEQPQSEATFQWLERMFVQTPVHVAIETCGILGACEPVPLAAGLPQRALVVHGADDDVVPVSVAEAIVESMPAAKLAVVPESGHLAIIDQKAAVNALLADFVESPTPG